MLRRLLVGVIKGAVIGGAVGAGIQLGLGWAAAGGLLGYLIAMGSGASAGILVGKPPWRAGVWLEALLKGLVGTGVGALIYFLGSTYASFDLPFALPSAAAGAAWPTQPLVVAPLVAMLFGAVVELDNTGSADSEDDTGAAKGNRKKGGAKARVGTDELELVDAEPLEDESPRKSRAAR